MTLQPPPEEVRDLAPTARLVFHVLRVSDEPLSVVSISELAATPPRSVRQGLAELTAIDLVEDVDDITAPRTPRYKLIRDDAE